ncbi:uncharacterized protein LOC123372238 [Mauremys mutica]|uniref:uncharacterized protein LOC123372238 n=1 Tax=Mauremys mutica TaxID=74926 RepID=UPI001D169929|nr:uncharacterized protein LOC123372238 [Mauremys mutica]
MGQGNELNVPVKMTCCEIVNSIENSDVIITMTLLESRDDGQKIAAELWTSHGKSRKSHKCQHSQLYSGLLRTTLCPPCAIRTAQRNYDFGQNLGDCSPGNQNTWVDSGSSRCTPWWSDLALQAEEATPLHLCWACSAWRQGIKVAEGRGCRLQALSRELPQALTPESSHAELQMDSRLPDKREDAALSGAAPREDPRDPWTLADEDKGNGYAARLIILISYRTGEEFDSSGKTECKMFCRAWSLLPKHLHLGVLDKQFINKTKLCV